MTFRVGMKVRLKSGGPMMTVQGVDDETIACCWFDKATLRNGVFLAQTIDDADVIEDSLRRLKDERGVRAKPESSAS